MTRAMAFAKINLGLVVGPLRADGKHEVVTVLQRIDVHDDIELERANALFVEGFVEDTIVRTTLVSLARAAAVEPHWRVRIEKRIPVAAGLGGGSSDAAAALQLASATLAQPLEPDVAQRLAADVGADVPFFLREGTQLATGDGTELVRVTLPTDYHVVLVVPHGGAKESTAAVYAAFDARSGADGYAERAATFHRALASTTAAVDLALLPPNDLAASPLTRELEIAGAFRADVSGAGPTVYGLFERADEARRAAKSFAEVGQTLLTRPIPTVDLP
jgi:4-diphosphocytidyl-2-C-methyl-D-erythritol kinase